MQLSNNKHVAIQPVTILVRYDDEQGEQEEHYPGFLTGGLHVMYVEENNQLLFASVAATKRSQEYWSTSGYFSLGTLAEDMDGESVIKTLASKLHGMSAYEFITRVLIDLGMEIQFEDFIIPKLLDPEGEGERK